MDRLRYVIIFTGDVAGMKRFYQDGLGLAAREHSPEWVEFDTTGATLAVHAMPESGRRGIQLRFATDDIEARVRELAARGVKFDPTGIDSLPWGRIASFSDPENNHLTLWEPSERHVTGSGPTLSAVVNCRDMVAARRFYGETLGFPTAIDTAWWVQLSTGEAALGLHPRTKGRGGERHHGRGITIGFAIPGLTDWYDEALARGVAFTAPPGDRGFGSFADTVDPDGNPVTLRDVPEPGTVPETLEEQLAEPFEDDAAPSRAAVRKPVKKRAKATSRVATRPRYRSGKAAPKRRHAAKPAARVASPRGTGPAGTRLKPKRKHDPKRARTKPAIGRMRKAERRTFKSQKQAVASASKRKPVKRASRARPAKRAVTRGTARR